MSDETPEVSAELQGEIQQYQQLQQQVQVMGRERQQLEGLELQTKQALEGLQGRMDCGSVFRMAGGLLLQQDPSELEAKLTEELEMLELRVKRAKGQYDDLVAQLKKRQEALQSKLQGSQ